MWFSKARASAKFSEVKVIRQNGEIVTINVFYGYSTDMPLIVDSVSITIKVHGVYVMVGRNGSVKMSLRKILQGLYAPTNGRVLLDGVNIS